MLSEFWYVVGRVELFSHHKGLFFFASSMIFFFATIVAICCHHLACMLDYSRHQRPLVFSHPYLMFARCAKLWPQKKIEPLFGSCRIQLISLLTTLYASSSPCFDSCVVHTFSSRYTRLCVFRYCSSCSRVTHTLARSHVSFLFSCTMILSLMCFPSLLCMFVQGLLS